MLKEILVGIYGWNPILVSVDVEKKTAHAKEMTDEGFYQGFNGNGVVGEDKKLTAITNDITTNYLKVAMVKAMQYLGIDVEDIQPSPINRKFEIIEVKN